ncbi:hypothetical protein ACKWTF_001578 [Chironomus riparius]
MIYEEPIKTLPENLFEKQHKLEYLILADNNFDDLPENIFRSLKYLKFFVFWKNGIKNLKLEWFHPLENVEELWLNSNYFGDIPKNIFTHLSNLTDLEMLDTGVSVIHSDSFGIHPNLTRMFFNNNLIYAIDEKFFDNVNPNVEADFRRNICTNRRAVGIKEVKKEFRQCFDNYKKLSESSIDHPIKKMTNAMNSNIRPDQRNIKLENIIKQLRQRIKF